jgi:hypothetical protein
MKEFYQNMGKETSKELKKESTTVEQLKLATLQLKSV